MSKKALSLVLTIIMTTSMIFSSFFTARGEELAQDTSTQAVAAADDIDPVRKHDFRLSFHIRGDDIIASRDRGADLCRTVECDRAAGRNAGGKKR